ncbi:MAG TPA: hypothetical protein VFH15_10475 [Pyrinomonadaceae bacterium]|nr:hypothetical protein [Pyrinomonadaceae bacterium]
MTNRKVSLLLALLLMFPFTASDSVVNGVQGRDHFTELEVEQIKETQILDKRIGVFVKAIERRLRVLTGTTTDTAKQQKKDSELYGELPSGSRAELIGDIAKILDEAITNIDDVSSRDEKNPLIPIALRLLANEAKRVVEQLRPLQSQASGDAEVGSIEQVTENAESILAAANKLPPPVAKEKKSKQERPKN